jgi:signal peptidase I
MKRLDFKVMKPNTLLDKVLVMIGNLFFLLCLVCATALIIFSSVTIECVVIGSSMQPTYNNDIKAGNDIVYVNTNLRDYAFGDIIVIDIHEQDPIIKRVIGLPGDVIDVVFNENDGYKLEINGKLIEEDYLKIDYELIDTNMQNGIASTYLKFHSELKDKYPELFENGKLVVPDGEIFALGDNRHDSKDSTYYGTFKQSDILGKVELVRYHDEGKFQFYLEYLTQGKFFFTIASCFGKA